MYIPSDGDPTLHIARLHHGPVNARRAHALHIEEHLPTSPALIHGSYGNPINHIEHTDVHVVGVD